VRECGQALAADYPQHVDALIRRWLPDREQYAQV
jgi:hypothetical protein